MRACTPLEQQENRTPGADENLTFEALIERDGLAVSRSPWGDDDHIGRLNWITPESQERVLEQLDGSKVFDLSVDYFIGMPSWQGSGDPKYDIWMTHTPTGSVVDDASGFGPDAHRTYTYSGDSIAMYTHVGTHIDTLNHMGYFGCIWNGWNVQEHLGSRHWRACGPEKYPPIIARGVLLDIAGLYGVDRLPDDHVITPGDLKKAAKEHGVELRRGDLVHVRTGAMSTWPNWSSASLDQSGINVPAARYLCEEGGAMCVAADNAGLEAFPPEDPEAFLPVHAYMAATAGAIIIELVSMEELAGEGIYEFTFCGFPLKLTGATAAAVRPVAVALRR